MQVKVSTRNTFLHFSEEVKHASPASAVRTRRAYSDHSEKLVAVSPLLSTAKEPGASPSLIPVDELALPGPDFALPPLGDDVARTPRHTQYELSERFQLSPDAAARHLPRSLVDDVIFADENAFDGFNMDANVLSNGCDIDGKSCVVPRKEANAATGGAGDEPAYITPMTPSPFLQASVDPATADTDAIAMPPLLAGATPGDYGWVCSEMYSSDSMNVMWSHHQWEASAGEAKFWNGDTSVLGGAWAQSMCWENGNGTCQEQEFGGRAARDSTWNHDFSTRKDGPQDEGCWDQGRDHHPSWWGNGSGWDACEGGSWEREARKDVKNEDSPKGSCEEQARKGKGRGKEREQEHSKECSDANSDRSPKGQQEPAVAEPDAGNTTVMLRNIPNKYTREMLVERLNEELRGRYDFLYLPIDFKNKCNVGYGFINFSTAEACQDFMRAFNGVEVRTCLPGFNSKKIVEVTPARVQGLTENVRRLRNSPVMTQLRDHPQWLPLLFDDKGEVLEPFPAPEQPLPPVKPRGGRSKAH
eukprot:gnl/TRDRNA2_/TRDRNA2_89918_c0_seq1.p1 gnl/TRDRNA2_/TRDRNA2_89918_c0~~gnl/TRDRNA2_/TRDRNA2_89918_c0_seq1.p1  ORF type:complete len:529 (+),score=93.02 gnl/TRDRNA2_/TRDRNA2_89918_c0_seq1:70-1656(+)